MAVVRPSPAHTLVPHLPTRDSKIVCYGAPLALEEWILEFVGYRREWREALREKNCSGFSQV